jgi:3-methyladenine DNA glycosylase AlkD
VTVATPSSLATGAGTAEVAVAALAQYLRSEASALADPVRAAQEKRYLKSDLDFVGVPVPATRALVKGVLAGHLGLDRAAIVALAGRLWDSRVFEHRRMAVEVLTARRTSLGPPDLGFVEGLLRQARTWALVDPLAGDVAGAIVGADGGGEARAVLDRWAGDADFWLRRSALLALRLPLRSQPGEFERFGRYADAMLEDQEFFVRKAIGWVLREVGRRQPDAVYAWLLPRAARASGVTLAEALKPLGAEQRALLIAAKGSKDPGRHG